MRATILLIVLSGLLAACGGGSSSGGNPPPTNPPPVTPPPVSPPPANPPPTNPPPAGEYRPAPQSLSQLILVDATGEPLAFASIQLAPAGNAQAISLQSLSAHNAYTTDAEGKVQIDGLAAGNYQLLLEKNNTQSQLLLQIESTNASTTGTLAMPLVVENNGQITPITDQGFVASFNGIIYDAQGPVENAQIEISAGAASNGPIAISTSNHLGEFTLIINVGSQLIPALNNLSLRIVREGYQPLVQTGLDLTQVKAVAGFNKKIVVGQSFGSLVYEETFEQLESGATCGSWTAEVAGFISELHLWNAHTVGRAIRNQALLNNLVRLAPDDSSLGYVPDPLTPTACWYGQSTAGVGRGNFLGVPQNNGSGSLGGDILEGGTSESPHGGAIVSPMIDLRTETAPLALTFRSWWEIESVNPNENGFDLLAVEYRVEGDTHWSTLARFNPLSDPVGIENRAPLPYSNRGYNKAPAWLWQEPISLDQLAGQRVQLRLAFYTVDELYNGFRGWLVDDIRTVREPGSFPLWQGGENFWDDF